MPHARTTDPTTSHVAGVDTPARRTQAERLLMAIAASADGLTSEEAARATSLLRPNVSYWRRVTELREKGLVDNSFDEEGRLYSRIGSGGVGATVWHATSSGKLLARVLTASAPIEAVAA